MHHRLNQKFLTLVAIKGLVMGYAQWAGAITAPSDTPLLLRSSGFTSDLLRSTPPSSFSYQNIHQF